MATACAGDGRNFLQCLNGRFETTMVERSLYLAQTTRKSSLAASRPKSAVSPATPARPICSSRWSVAAMNGKVSLLTTNLPFSAWPTISPNAATATAPIDHLVHHAEILTIEGDSYRRRVAEAARKPRATAQPVPPAGAGHDFRGFHVAQQPPRSGGRADAARLAVTRRLDPGADRHRPPGRPSRAPAAHRRRRGGRGENPPVRPPGGLLSVHADAASWKPQPGEQLEHLCRSLLRPPLALDRLTESTQGRRPTQAAPRVRRRHAPAPVSCNPLRNCAC